MLATISGSLDQQLLLRNDYLVSENRSWGYRRIVGALSNYGYELSHQTVGNVLQRHGLLPAPDRERKTSWREFIRSHTEVLAAVDFFTAEVWTSAAKRGTICICLNWGVDCGAHGCWLGVRAIESSQPSLGSRTA